MQNGMQNSMDQSRLMAEGMPCSEAFHTMEAARAESRRVGSAESERCRTRQRVAKERLERAFCTPRAVHGHVTNVLLIDGTGMAGDWMSDKLLLQNDTGMFGLPDPEERRALEAAWRDMQYKRVGLDGGNRAHYRALSSGHRLGPLPRRRDVGPL